MTKNTLIERYKKWLLDEKYDGTVPSDPLRLSQYKQDILRIKNGEPIDYIIGYSYFLGNKIDLSHKPLIPRPETEYWVDIAINEIQSKGHEAKELMILDMFSGSGCIGISILSKIPNSKVDFIDISEDCLSQIKLNLYLNNIPSDRYRVLKSNIYESITPDARYDYIFANPPYIKQMHEGRVEDSVYNFEPHLALFSGEDGLDAIRILIKESSTHLYNHGVLYLEFDDIQVEKIEAIAQICKANITFHKDCFDKYRYAKVLYK